LFAGRRPKRPGWAERDRARDRERDEQCREMGGHPSSMRCGRVQFGPHRRTEIGGRTRAKARTPHGIRSHSGPRSDSATPPSMPNRATPIAPLPCPLVRRVVMAPGRDSAAIGNSRGDNASHRPPRRPPVRRRCSAQPIRPPTTPPGRITPRNVPSQVKVESGPASCAMKARRLDDQATPSTAPVPSRPISVRRVDITGGAVVVMVRPVIGGPASRAPARHRCGVCWAWPSWASS
jgi:hypothetical protein